MATQVQAEFPARMRQLRLARGWSFDDLVGEIGGAVTKAALAKYESGQMRPSTRVLNLLSSAFGVKTAHLLRPPGCEVKFVAYRKGAALTKMNQAQIEALVAQSLEQRVWLQATVHDPAAHPLRVAYLPVEDVPAAEKAAATIRKDWKLGLDPIANLVDTLENQHVHVVEIDAPPKFDGISAYATQGHAVCAAAVASRIGVCGERQRFSLAHELGHLVMDVGADIDEEKAAHRFAAAFLAPAETIVKEVGGRRTRVSIDELMLWKQRFGISMQALIYRLKDLGIITESYCQTLFKVFSANGWRRKEPGEFPAEKPNWLRKTIIRAAAEGLVSREQAETILGAELPCDTQPAPMRRRQFMKLPIEKRREILQQQAERMASHYESTGELEGIGGGDFIDDGSQ